MTPGSTGCFHGNSRRDTQFGTSAGNCIRLNTKEHNTNRTKRKSRSCWAWLLGRMCVYPAHTHTHTHSVTALNKHASAHFNSNEPEWLAFYPLSSPHSFHKVKHTGRENHSRLVCQEPSWKSFLFFFSPLHFFLSLRSFSGSAERAPTALRFHYVGGEVGHHSNLKKREKKKKKP